MTTLDNESIVYTGPGTLAGRYLRMFWQPVYRAEDLAPGRAMPIRIMSEDFTLYRGEGGIPHVVAFRLAGWKRIAFESRNAKQTPLGR